MHHRGSKASGRMFTAEVLLYLTGACTIAVASFAVQMAGGITHPVAASLLVIAAAEIIKYGLVRAHLTPGETLQDGLVGGLLALSACQTMKVWQAPAVWYDLLSITAPVAGLACIIYLVLLAYVLRKTGRHLSCASGFGMLLAPCLFNWLLLLQSPVLLQQIGGFVLLSAPLSPELLQWAGRGVVLVVLNEAVALGLNFLFSGRLLTDGRLHLLLAASALLASATPSVAGWGSGAQLASLPPVLGIGAAVAAAVLSQAGLWAQTFLLTGLFMDALKGKNPLWYWGSGHYSSGLLKGAVYSVVFMGLIQAVAGITALPQVWSLLIRYPLASAGLAGAFVFPLLKTIIESFDGNNHFFQKLLANYADCTLFMRGVVLGVGVAIVLQEKMMALSGQARWLSGFAVGVAAYALVDLVRDGIDSAVLKKRLRLQSWRVYTVEAMLGGLAGGALAWYFDQLQADAVIAKFKLYAAINYAAQGVPIQEYVVYPLFSKWGAMNLGVVNGGTRLLYSETLSGVINWSIAAPLFSINFVVLSALLQRSTAPLRNLFTRRGLGEVAEQAFRVQRWGLWMAPIIYSFLRMSPHPTWYNQDGAIRTLVAALKGFVSSPDEFRLWSLQLFTSLLAFDWLRIAIFIDHMGLRVATLVNLSFVGVDIIDEKTARFLGHSGKTRVIAEGLRRFVTWAPLLLPFYLPRGGDWDYAWGQAAIMSGTRDQQLFPPGLIAGSFLVIALAGGAVMACRRLRSRKDLPSSGGYAVPAGERAHAVSALHEEPCVITNGLYTLTITADGRSWSRVFSQLRKGREFDITRRSFDSLDLCGKYFFLVDTAMPEGAPGRAWSLSYQPVCQPGQEYSLARHDRSSVDIQSTYNGIAASATVRIDHRDPVELWTVRLFNATDRNRTIELTSYRELVLNTPDAYLRHGDYNSIHVGTWFIRSLSALMAQNRLLKAKAAGPSGRSLFPEVAFHAVSVGQGEALHLTGYEDSRSYFIGDATLRKPQGLERKLRDPADEGLLYTFDPCASLRMRIQLPPGGRAELIYADGYGETMSQALKLMKKALAIPGVAPGSVEAALAKKRVLHGFTPWGENRDAARAHPRAHLVTRSLFSFSPDGTELQVGWNTSRPWGHVLANKQGYGAMVTNQGDIYSFMGNAQQNGITPHSTASLPVQVPGQVLYLFNIAQGTIDGPAFAPFRKKEGSASVTYGRGYAVFRKASQECTMELTVSVLPDEPAEVRLLRIHNRTAVPQTYRVVPYLQMVLGEIPADTRGVIGAAYDETLKALFFTNPRNDFYRGCAFVATNLAVQAYETVRARFVGGPGRDLCNPHMVEHGVADASAPDDGFRIASFVGTLTVPAHSEGTVVMVVGCTPDREQAGRIIRTYCSGRSAFPVKEKSGRFWSDMLSALRVETNNAAFDRLVNDWLPYQVLASHLWGRTGPNQRSGAYGFRDQLQSVLPLLYLNPALSREQILLHSGQQFYDGDAMQWWHRSWEGQTGLGVRNRAADPHLWLPYLVYRYVEATGDLAILNEEISFLEGKAIPKGTEGIIFAPRRSRDCASLYRHCMKALDFALHRFGTHGLPLMGTGDWNDGLNLVGRRGRGESVWLGFFLYDILTHFSRLIDLKEGRSTRDRYDERALRLRESLNALFADGRYPRATTDDGRLMFFSDALSAAWPVISGVADFERGACAMDLALKDLETDHLVRLLYPPFGEGEEINPGKLADYPPGVRENGGQYSHGASWLIDALMCLAAMAASAGDGDRETHYREKAVDLWMKISPVAHTTPDVIDNYGLPPHQQAADIYCGYGYQGRGGWSWYTGAAGRMLMGAYAILGLTLESGVLVIPDNLFEPRGGLQLKRLVYKGSECIRDAPAKDNAGRSRNSFQPRRFENR